MPTHKSFQRSDRMSAQLRREIGTLVHEAVRNDGLSSVRVFEVEVSRDMAHAKEFVTTLLPEQAVPAVKALSDRASEIRFRLGKILKWHPVPVLRFNYDVSV